MSLNKISRALQRSKDREKSNAKGTFSTILTLPHNGRDDVDGPTYGPNCLLILTFDRGEENQIMAQYKNEPTDPELKVLWSEKPIEFERIKNPSIPDDE